MATPTANPVLVLTSLEPSTVFNDQPSRIAIIGAGIVDTSYVVTIGGRTLSDVRWESPTALTAILPTGLCPGPYVATLKDASGRQASGGTITLQSVRAIVQDEAPTELSVPLTGSTQRRSIPLPSVQVEDSGCGNTDWRLVLAVALPRDKGHGKTLIPGVISVRWTDGGMAIDKLSHADGQNQEQGTLVIPRNGSARLLLTPSLEVEVPASTYVGSYTTALSVSFADQGG